MLAPADDEQQPRRKAGREIVHHRHQAGSLIGRTRIAGKAPRVAQAGRQVPVREAQRAGPLVARNGTAEMPALEQRVGLVVLELRRDHAEGSGALVLAHRFREAAGLVGAVAFLVGALRLGRLLHGRRRARRLGQQRKHRKQRTGAT